MARMPPGMTTEPGTGRLIPIQGRRCSILQFMNRLSEEEQVALAAVRIDTATPLSVRSALEVLKEQRDNTTDKHINLDDPRTSRGAQVALSVLAQLPEGAPGRVDPADVATRLAAWLADYPQSGELP